MVGARVSAPRMIQREDGMKDCKVGVFARFRVYAGRENPSTDLSGTVGSPRTNLASDRAAQQHASVPGRVRPGAGPRCCYAFPREVSASTATRVRRD